ncbi:undecaprenyl-phosphate glucose phosphotransferase [Rhodoferax ferrireducens]|uniref:undecaprenyl-phosphate glucose phosphotransferase n=1 Tax=Rhodoferax ferrireducens TaxID=192843 RepID=UPI00286C84F0|nr:undecaprenyl-phosphate glucose phosphotransferase [Rhodoferax ferrireducens]
MINALDKQKNFLRPSFTLPGALEAFLDPVVTMVTLAACLAWYAHPLSARYIILGVIAFSLSFPGNVGFHEPPQRMVRKLLTNWLVFLVILGGFGVATGYMKSFTRPVLIAWAVLTPLAQIGSHFFLRWALPKAITGSGQQRRVVITGVNEVGLRLLHEFESNPYLNTRVLGFFDDRSSDRLGELGKVPMLGRMSDLAEFMKTSDVEAIYLALPMASQPRILAVLDDLKDTTASIYFVPDIFMTDLIQGRLANVGPMPVMAVCETPFNGMSGLIKRASDIFISLMILILASPIFLALALAVKFTSPGPIIFKQRRYGLDGKEILVYKFRSMTTEDNGTVVKQATKNDSRITPLGAILRKTSLDELPQFVNVLQGRMSIVGPRPHAVAHNETYRKLVKGYMVRHKVKPGITGWAQVSGYRGETDTIDKMEKRIDYDLEYLRNWSLGFDLWIIVKTVLVVLNDKKAY